MLEKQTSTYRFPLVETRAVLHFAASQKLTPCYEDQLDCATWRPDANPSIMIAADDCIPPIDDVDPSRLYRKVMLVARVGVCLRPTSAPLERPSSLRMDANRPVVYALGHAEDDDNEIYTDGCEFALPVALRDVYALLHRHPHAPVLSVETDGWRARVVDCVRVDVEDMRSITTRTPVDAH